MTQLKSIAPAGEGTIISFFKSMSASLGDVQRTMLRHIASNLIDRGWLPPVATIFEQLAHEGDEAKLRAVLAELIASRLLQVDEAGEKIVGLMGTLSLIKTPHRAHLGSGVDVYTQGGMDLLSVNPMLAKPVDAFTACGKCGAAIKLRVADDAVETAEPAGLAGFQATWDGTAPLEPTSANSPLFCSDTCLEAWATASPEVDGLPMSADLLLFVGMGMAQESGNARFEIIQGAG